MTVGDRFIDAFVAKVYAGDAAPNPDEVRAFAEGMRRAFYIADRLAVPEHRAGMCRTSSRRCRRRAMLGTNTCEVDAAAFFDVTPAELVALAEKFRELVAPRLAPDEHEAVGERVELEVRGRRVTGTLVARHPQGDVVVADLTNTNDSEEESHGTEDEE